MTCTHVAAYKMLGFPSHEEVKPYLIRALYEIGPTTCAAAVAHIAAELAIDEWRLSRTYSDFDSDGSDTPIFSNIVQFARNDLVQSGVMLNRGYNTWELHVG